MVVGIALTQPFEGGRHRRCNAQWQPSDYGLVHGDIRTRRRELMGSSTGGEAQPRTAREPHELKAKSLSEC
jgi:hypothetical protein